MIKMLNDFPLEENKGTGSLREVHSLILELTDRLEGDYSDAEKKNRLYVETLFPIDSASTDLANSLSTDDLKRRLNTMKAILKQLGSFSYEELFNEFPLRLEIDGSFLREVSGFVWDKEKGFESLWDKLDNELSSMYGFQFNELVLSDIAGDEIGGFVRGTRHKSTMKLAWLFMDMANVLLAHDDETRSHYKSYDEIMDIPEMLA